MPTNKHGVELPPHAPPPQAEHFDNESKPWLPFDSRLEFDFAWYHFVKQQSSVSGINEALDLWAAAEVRHGGHIRWANAQALYDTIDEINRGDVPWRTFQLSYKGPLPASTPPKWMTRTYELCIRDSRQVLQQQMADPAFKDHMFYTPYRQFNAASKRVYSNLMSGDWAWQQAVCIISSHHYIANINTIGQNRRRPSNSWLHVCPSGGGERQDYSFCSYWSSRIPSRLPVSWAHLKLSATSSW